MHTTFRFALSIFDAEKPHVRDNMQSTEMARVTRMYPLNSAKVATNDKY